MSDDRKLWRTEPDYTRPDYESDETDIQIPRNRTTIVAVSLQETDEPYEEYDLSDGMAPVRATEEEARRWTHAYADFVQVCDTASSKLQAVEKVWLEAKEQYRKEAGAALREYVQRANRPIMERFEEMRGELEAAKAGEEAEEVRRAEALLAQDDAVLGGRDWVISRPKIDYQTSFSADALVPTVHQASCATVKKKGFPPVRLEEVKDLARDGGDEIHNARNARFERGRPTGRKLPVKWCRRCHSAEALLAALEDDRPKWVGQVEAAVTEATYDRLHTRPKITTSDVRSLLQKMGLPVHKEGVAGFYPKEPHGAHTWKTVKSAELIHVAYTSQSGLMVFSRDLREDPAYAGVLEFQERAEALAPQYGYWVRSGTRYSLEVTKLTRAERAQRDQR